MTDAGSRPGDGWRDTSDARLIGDVFSIEGRVGSDAFPAWIAGHARKLGVEAVVVSRTAFRIELRVRGAAALVDALEMGCSLGPYEVLVERISRRAVP